MVVVGHDSSEFRDSPHQAVDDDVREKTPLESVSAVYGFLRESGDLRDEAICDTVAERDKHDRDKGGHGVAGIIPVDSADLAHHQEASLPHAR